jgi:ArsR family transcriptional regulator
MKSAAMNDLIVFFKVLSEPNRLRIIHLLMHAGETCVCDIEHALGLPQARVSRHLTMLRAARIVVVRRSGAWMHYTLAPRNTFEKSVYAALRKSLATMPELESDRKALKRLPSACGPEAARKNQAGKRKSCISG